jgi:hypothetical protein
MVMRRVEGAFPIGRLQNRAASPVFDIMQSKKNPRPAIQIKSELVIRDSA